MAVEDYNEQEQSERVKAWLRENGMSLVLAVVLVISGIFGWRAWLGYQDGQQQAAAERYSLMEMELAGQDLGAARDHLDALIDDHPRNIYAAVGALSVAGALVQDERLEDAAELYRMVIEHRRASKLHPVARLRLSRVLLAMDELDEAMAVLEEESPPDSYRSAWAEVRGDILLERGEKESARMAFQEALDHMPEDAGSPALLQIKLDHAGGPVEDGDAS